MKLVEIVNPEYPLIQRPERTDSYLAWVAPVDTMSDDFGDDQLQVDLRREQRRNRKLQDRINRLVNLIPGRSRAWELIRLATELEAHADITERLGLKGDPGGLRSDALFLQRLEYDLITLNDVKGEQAGGGNRKYDDRQWPRGERP